MMLKMLRKKEVADRLGISLMTLWRWEKAGRFPKSSKIGANTVAYLESDIDDWIAAKTGDAAAMHRVYIKQGLNP